MITPWPESDSGSTAVIVCVHQTVFGVAIIDTRGEKDNEFFKSDVLLNHGTS